MEDNKNVNLEAEEPWIVTLTDEETGGIRTSRLSLKALLTVRTTLHSLRQTLTPMNTLFSSTMRMARRLSLRPSRTMTFSRR